MSPAKPMRRWRYRKSSGVAGAATVCLPLLIFSIFASKASVSGGNFCEQLHAGHVGPIIFNLCFKRGLKGAKMANVKRDLKK